MTLTLISDYYERLCEAFVQQLSYTCMIPTGYAEDTLCVLQTFSQYVLIDALPDTDMSYPRLADREEFHNQLLSEIYRIMGLNLDKSMDSTADHAYQNPRLQRCLNLQPSFGYAGEDFSRSLPGLVASTALGLRYCSMLLSMAFTKNPFYKPGGLYAEQETKNPGMSIYNLFV